MSVVCVVLGFWSTYVNPFRRQAQSLAVLDRLHAEVNAYPANGPAWQRWLVKTILGENAYVRVESVALRGPRVDDEVLLALAGLNQLNRLSLEQTLVSDRGLSAFESMRNLQALSLAYSAISDRGIASLLTLPKLADLKLTGTDITDAAVTDLARLPAATALYLRWTKISDAGAERLRQSNPECAVHHQVRFAP